MPDAGTISATNIFLNSATLNGSVNANYLSTSAIFEWGTTTDYGKSVEASQSPVSGNTPLMVSSELSGLTEETTYHYRIKAENSLGITYSPDKTFTTAGKSPVPVTMAATLVQVSSASLNGSVNANSFLTTVAFEWGTTTGYGNTFSALQSSITGNTYTNVNGKLSGLAPGTTYHFRIIAENEFGKRTSDDMTFTTLMPVTDIDGNVYNVIQYGDQIWMTENLKTTRYNNGDLIGTTSPPALNIDSESTPKYQWAYDGNESNVLVYGRLYTWYTATDSRNICPTGWHVPTDDDWTGLTDYLTNNGYGFEGSGSDIAKSMAATHLWPDDVTVPGVPGNDISSNNSSGFSGLPAGVRGSDQYGETSFGLIGAITNWWTSSAYLLNIEYKIIYIRFLGYGNADIFREYQNPVSGLSVRCMKN